MAVGGGGLKGLVRLGWCAGYGALNALGLYRSSAPPVAYVTEKANWSIQWDARSYVGAIEACHPGTVAVTHRPQSLIGRVVHFGSQFHWGQWSRALSASNRTIVTYYHGKPADGPEMARHVDYFLANMKRLSGVVTASRMVERRLLGETQTRMAQNHAVSVGRGQHARPCRGLVLRLHPPHRIIQIFNGRLRQLDGVFHIVCAMPEPQEIVVMSGSLHGNARFGQFSSRSLDALQDRRLDAQQVADGGLGRR